MRPRQHFFIFLVAFLGRNGVMSLAKPVQMNKRRALNIFFRRSRTATPVFQHHTGLEGIALLADYALSLRPEKRALLQAETAERRASQWRLAALNSLPDAMAVLDDQGTILFVNEAGKARAGTSFFHMAAAGLGENFLDHCDRAPDGWADQARRAAEAVRQVLAGEPGPFELEYPCPGRPEQEWFQLKVCPLCCGEIEGALLTLADVTGRKSDREKIHRLKLELERNSDEKTAQLRAAVEELEAFSYSVSHDLRAPLRAIHGFSRILAEDFPAQLPPKAQHYLQLVRQSADEMQQLIESLLSFARLHRQPLQKQTVAPAEQVRQCLETLLDPRERRQIDVVVGELPVCEADPTLLKQVWANLLSNALKFTNQKESARIEVGCERRGGEDVYFVRDNGVGFDMKYSDKLFRVFQRLHRAEDFGGTGIGLALIQRIVQRHGGQVWAEAQAGQGATFYFTLRSSSPVPGSPLK